MSGPLMEGPAHFAGKSCLEVRNASQHYPNIPQASTGGAFRMILVTLLTSLGTEMLSKNDTAAIMFSELDRS